MQQGDFIHRDQRRGRAAASNRTNRFESLTKTAIDDGWDIVEELPVLRTEVRDETITRIISRNSSPDLGFDRSINPYRGCEHGCIYCFARPSHAYLGLSPGLDFETQLIARPGAAARLEAELRNPRYRPKLIAIGTNTDAYQPIERDRAIMREILEVLSSFRHPVGIVTKGALIERDIDILAEMASAGLARVGVSVTTLDPRIARVMEPRVPSPARRLKVIERLSRAGIPVRVMASPIIPGLTDPEIEAIVQAGADAGATAASGIGLRLPREVAPLFRDWLEEHFPMRAARVMARVREMHGGKDYDPSFGTRLTGTGIYAQLLRDRFKRAARAAGLAADLAPLRCDLFTRPVRSGDQMSLF
ncbi:DNA repair photolyase [Litoreibacter ponti]|uniref:DNA repair photolyase n=1 Tax=Litoreibacter ponti TaxID=1510457 RepID=A0A2T6BI38_9RHOB|nr:PA0069 family radical SAM protein [Litoreibacter ponti]PTX55727.1 DNA repair photolyase [Litoreibacter ponti]